MFDDGHGDADNIDFLEGVRAHEICRHLACDENNRNRVHIGIGDSGDQIGCARTGGRKGRAGFPGCPRITNGGHAAALLMTAKNMAKLRVIGQLVIDRHNRPARISKNNLHALRRNGLKQELRAGFRLAVFQNFRLLTFKLCGCGHCTISFIQFDKFGSSNVIALIERVIPSCGNSSSP